MIAVFCLTQRDFDDLGVTPKDKFKRINSVEDIQGVKFDGVIRMYKWFNYDERCDAYEYLEATQPELFINNKITRQEIISDKTDTIKDSPLSDIHDHKQNFLNYYKKDIEILELRKTLTETIKNW